MDLVKGYCNLTGKIVNLTHYTAPELVPKFTSLIMIFTIFFILYFNLFLISFISFFLDGQTFYYLTRRLRGIHVRKICQRQP